MHIAYAKCATLKSCFQCCIFSLSLASCKAKNPVFSPSLHQATKPKIVIPGYMVQRKSVSDTSVFALLCAKQRGQDASRIQRALPLASGAGEVISERLEVPAIRQTIWTLSFQDRGKLLIFMIALLQLHQSGCIINKSTTTFSDLPLFHVLHS